MAEQEKEVEVNGDPMMIGCFIFASPFALLVAWIVLALIFDYRG